MPALCLVVRSIGPVRPIDSLRTSLSHFRCCALPMVLASCLLMLTGQNFLQGEDAPDESDPLPGHSYHGEVFNEGPRQKAYLMEGMPTVSFEITTKDPEAQKFFNQGVGQLHGFWFFEAERSFRQAAQLDPTCAMAYWGMAQANIDNSKRSTDFIEQADQRKGSASERERMYIEALSAFIKTGSKKNKERHEAYTKALEKILYKYPDDLECRAFLALHLWKSRDSGAPIQSYIAVDAILDQIFLKQPMHPAHHYRIHLWDAERAENALGSAGLCGQSAAGIAHMWHMSGHIFARLKRYEDAAWQQEASARVDHAHMMRDKVMPDQIHNFAHNNEWLIRDLIFVGRAHDAVDLAKNMCELPRHPKYNTLTKRGSAYYGRLRLAESLVRFRMWDDLIEMANTPYLEPTEEVSEQNKRLRWLGMAQFRAGQIEGGEATLAEAKKRLAAKQEERTKEMDAAEAKLTGVKPSPKVELVSKVDESAVKAADNQQSATEPESTDTAGAKEKAPEESKKTEEEKEANEKDKPAEQEKKKEPPRDEKAIAKARETAGKKFDSAIKDLEKVVFEIEGHQAIAQGNYKEGLALLKKASFNDSGYLPFVQFQADDKTAALEAIRKHATSKKEELLPQVDLIELLWLADKKEEARENFERLRKQAGSADLDVPALSRLAAIAEELGFPADWRLPQEPAADVGIRPTLDSLGPFRWQPSLAPNWTLKDAEGKEHSLSDFSGKPIILIFFLGNGCLHCAEQLQAFAKAKADFEAVDLPLFAISSDDQAGLKLSIDNYEGGMPIPLVADPELTTFKAYRAFDDFEDQTLHGTFVIDGQGRIRWQDISYEPFMDVKFVKEEALRLLNKK